MKLKKYFNKKLASSILASALLLMVPFSVSAYNLTDADFSLLDQVEDKLFDMMERNVSLTAERVVDAVESLMEREDLNERTIAILETLVEDVEYFSGIDERGYDDDDEYVLLPEDCYEDEYYDAQDQRCYPDEDSDSGLDDDQDRNDYENYGDDGFNDDPGEIVFDASYGIQSDDTITLIAGKEIEQHQEMWNVFTSLITPSYRQDLLKVHFFNDAENDTFAYVAQIEDNEQYWQMAINVGLFYTDGETIDMNEAVHTLIHEFTHILTLNKDQVTYVPLSREQEQMILRYEAACKTHFLQEGCLQEDAYLKAYIDDFWTQEEREIAAEEEGVEYSEHKFVSVYASSNPGEDIAESFTYFVLNTKPTGSTIREQKMLFFYQYPELIKLRNLIRSRVPN